MRCESLVQSNALCSSPVQSSNSGVSRVIQESESWLCRYFSMYYDFVDAWDTVHALSFVCCSFRPQGRSRGAGAFVGLTNALLSVVYDGSAGTEGLCQARFKEMTYFHPDPVNLSGLVLN